MMPRTISLLLLFLLHLLTLASCGTATPAQAPTAPRTATLSVTPSPQGPSLTLIFHCPDLTKDGFVVTTAHGRVCVTTLPEAHLTIAVRYCVGNTVPDHSPALQGAFQAGSTGYYEWNWQPQAPQATCVQQGSFTSGSATVTAQLGGQVITSTATFQFG